MTLSSAVNIESRDYYKKIIDLAEKKPNEEICGFVYLDRLLNPCITEEVNQSDDKVNSFYISPSRFLEVENIIGVYHSHVKDSAKPSNLDLLNSEETGLPFLIYSNTDKDFWLNYPESYEPMKLTGRPFVRGFYQCFTLIKDYFEIELGDKDDYCNYNYWPDFDGAKANKYLLGILNKKYTRVKDGSIKRHDVLIFETKDPTVHAAMYKGQNEFYHHPSWTLSSLDDFTERWQKRVKYVFRHNSLV
jgi:proteasome lid subunit RPN8/RPN11